MNQIHIDIVTDHRQQKFLTQKRHALRQLDLHVLYQLPFPPLRFQRCCHSAHHHRQFFAAHRLKDIIRRMHLQRRFQIFSIIMPADEHDFDVRQQCTDLRRHSYSIHSRHLHIGQHNIRPKFSDKRKSRIPVVSSSNQLDSLPGPIYIGTQPVYHRRFIVHNDQRFHWHVPFDSKD
ncbi:hypothetical protein D3C80_1186840 [compost metagenome]